MWLALANPNSAGHDRACRYWRNESAERIAFTEATALGFLRLSGNAHAMGPHVLSTADSWRQYKIWRDEENVELLYDLIGLESMLEHLVADDLVTPGNWTDAVIAAGAQLFGARVVTFDRGFARFPAIDSLILEP